MEKKIKKSECSILHEVEDKATFDRIEQGVQKVVFDYFDRKSIIQRWYSKESSGKHLVIQVWCGEHKAGNKSIAFMCDCIWDSDNWSWFGWLPEEKIYFEFDEPGGDHFVLYLGEKVELV